MATTRTQSGDNPDPFIRYAVACTGLVLVVVAAVVAFAPASAIEFINAVRGSVVEPSTLIRIIHTAPDFAFFVSATILTGASVPLLLGVCVGIGVLTALCISAYLTKRGVWEESSSLS